MNKFYTSLILLFILAIHTNIYAQQPTKGGKVTVVRSSSNTSSNEELISKKLTFSDLHGIKAGSIFEVELVKGNNGKVTVSAPERTMKHIIVEEKNGVLILRLDNGYRIRPKGSKVGPINVIAEVSSLTLIDLSGASKVHSKEHFHSDLCDIELSGATSAKLTCSAETIKIDLSGASILNLNGTSESLKAELSGASKLNLNLSSSSESIKADLSGASTAKIKGKTDALDLDCSGASNFDGDELQAKVVIIDLSGASKAKVNARQKLTGEVSGASNLKYNGKPDKIILEKSRGAYVSHK